MTCPRSSDIDLAAYLVDPDAPEWTEFRGHFPECPECAADVAGWSRTEATMRAAGEDFALRHVQAELLSQFEQAPRLLAASERQQIETHLRSCRTCADQLAALREFDFGFIERSAPESPWKALRAAAASIGRGLGRLASGDSEGNAGGPLGEGLFPSREPALVFQSRTGVAAGSVEGAASAAAVAVLAATEGSGSGSVHGILPGQNRIGRASICEIQISNESLTRVEARITEADGEFEIASLNPRRSVTVNDAPTQQGRLRDGDRVEIGGLRFRFRPLDPS